MSEPRFHLYYWPLPFRGCFVSYLLAWADEPFDLADMDALVELKSREPGAQEVPFVGPPVLHDRRHDGRPNRGRIGNRVYSHELFQQQLCHE